MRLLCRLGFCSHPKFNYRAFTAADREILKKAGQPWNGVLMIDDQFKDLPAPPQVEFQQMMLRAWSKGYLIDGARLELVAGELVRLGR